MKRTIDAKLVAALARVEQCGDMAPDSDHSPSTMIMRHWAVRDDLMRWDCEERRYFLTPRGTALVRPSRPQAFTLLPFNRRADRRAG